MDKIKINNLKLSVTDEELFEEMKQYVLSNYRAINYLKKHDLTDEDINNNIVKIFDFVSDFEYCSKCPGIEKCNKSNPHLCTRIVKKNNEIDRQLVPCSKIIERMSFESRFILNDIDEEIIDRNVFVSEDKKGVQANNKLMLKKIRMGKDYDWYYFCYDNFVESIKKGFTIAVCLMESNELSKIAYINFPKRVKELNDIMFLKDKTSQFEYNKKLEQLCNVPILAIEGFGDEFINDFNRDSIVSQIINTRSTKKLATIFISKYKIKDIESLYSTSKSGEIRAKQLAKTIKVMCGTEFED